MSGDVHSTHRVYKNVNDLSSDTEKIQHPKNLPSKPKSVGQTAAPHHRGPGVS